MREEEGNSTGTPASLSPIASPDPVTTRCGYKREYSSDRDANTSEYTGRPKDDDRSSTSSIYDQPVSPCIPFVSNGNGRSNGIPQSQIEVLSKIFPAYPTDLLQITLLESRGSVSRAVERVLYGSAATRASHTVALRSSYNSAYTEKDRYDYGLSTLSTLSTLVRYCNRCGLRAFATDNFCSACGCVLRKKN